MRSNYHALHDIRNNYMHRRPVVWWCFVRWLVVRDWFLCHPIIADCIEGGGYRAFERHLSWLRLLLWLIAHQACKAEQSARSPVHLCKLIHIVFHACSVWQVFVGDSYIYSLNMFISQFTIFCLFNKICQQFLNSEKAWLQLKCTVNCLSHGSAEKLFARVIGNSWVQKNRSFGGILAKLWYSVDTFYKR